MKLTVLSYQCDNCGLCCTAGMFVKVNHIDAMREPRILSECRRLKMGDKIVDEWMLNRVDNVDENLGPCTFHDGKHCTIYASRPNVCAGFMAGGKDCQDLRAKAGLPPLLPGEPREIEEQYATLVPESEACQSGTTP